jgi:hypothetical protein
VPLGWFALTVKTPPTWNVPAPLLSVIEELEVLSAASMKFPPFSSLTVASVATVTTSLPVPVILKADGLALPEQVSPVPQMKLPAALIVTVDSTDPEIIVPNWRSSTFETAVGVRTVAEPLAVVPAALAASLKLATAATVKTSILIFLFMMGNPFPI